MSNGAHPTPPAGTAPDTTSRAFAADPADPPLASQTVDMEAVRTLVRDRRMTVPSGWRTAGHLAAAVAVYTALAAVVLRVDHWAVWVPAWFAMGWLLVGNGAIGHAAIHGHLCRSSRLNRVIGIAAGALILLPWGEYRAGHLVHHATTATDADPQGLPIAYRSRLELMLTPLGGVLFIGELNWINIRTALGGHNAYVRNREQLRDIRTSAVAVAVVAALLVWGAFADLEVVVKLWLMPFLFAASAIFPFLAVAEHAYGAPGEALDNSRTAESNALVRWAYWNTNYHAAHHLVPAVTHRHTRELSELFRADQHDGWWVRGYVPYYWRLFRSLPTFPPRRPPQPPTTSPGRPERA